MLTRFKKPLIIALVVIVAFFALGFRIDHPQSGLKSALGSAKSSLAIYRGVGQPSIGNKVLVNLPGAPGDSPALAIVRTVSGGKVEVLLDNKIQIVSEKDIVGKLVLVVPFFGAILGIVGL
jgi:hypothetical protein